MTIGAQHTVSNGCLLVAAILLVSPGISRSAVISGQTDNFQDGTTQNWTNGPMANPVNVASDGPAGAADRFLQISSGTFGGGSKLVSFNQSQWIGNYITAAVNSITMDLKNFTGSDESIRIALRSGTGGLAGFHKRSSRPAHTMACRAMKSPCESAMKSTSDILRSSR